MTFDEWFESRFPPVSDHMRLVRESYREIAREAWNQGVLEQTAHYEEMSRLDEYERSVFGE